jgi:putative transposase
VPNGCKHSLPTRAASPEHGWSEAFVHDEPTEGRRLKCLTIVDVYTRASLPIDCARSMTGEEGVQVRRQLVAYRGTPWYG